MHFLSEIEVDPDGPQNQLEHPNGESIELSPQSRKQLVLEWIVPIIAVVALVQVSWQFAEGILLVDGERIPPFLQVDTYVVIKSQRVWSVAAHNMQEKKQ